MRTYLLYGSVFLALACAGAPPRVASNEVPGSSAGSAPSDASSSVAGSSLSSGISRDGFELGVAPTQDFFQHVNGRWLEQTQIPSDKSDYGSFIVLQDAAERDQKAIIVDCVQAAKALDDANASEGTKIGNLYLSYMDSEGIDQRGVQPLQPLLREVAAVTDAASLWQLMGRLGRIGIAGPVGFFVGQDAKNSERYIGQIYQAGLGLPDRDYYLQDEPRFVEIRSKYQQHIARQFELAGLPGGADKSETVLNFETRLAEIQWTRVERRDRNRAYSKQSMQQLEQLAPGVGIADYLRGAEVPPLQEVIVRQDTYFQAASKLLESTSLADMKAYLQWRLLSDTAPYLHQAMVDEDFAFFGKTLRGTEVNRERWKRAVDTVEQSLGQAVGKLYVEKHFPKEAKQRMERLVDNLLKSFGQGIDELEWMSAETKGAAREKLSKFVAKIGYPAVWLDYSKLQIDPHDLLGNVHRARAFEHDRTVARLAEPVDRDEWFITPQTVNAYYSPSKNEIVFPAAILQPPFFDLKADDAVNYGAIGAVIGHEISHGFDDQGRKSDGDGNLRDWWSARDADAFVQRSALMVEQYNGFKPFEDASVNGELTLGENIGDLGGLTIAYRAYRMSLGGAEAPLLDGYSGAQRFFFGWAQIWRRKYREDELRRRLLTDPHAPSRYRVNGIVANMPEFYEAFSVQEGDAMWRPISQRVKIW